MIMAIKGKHNSGKTTFIEKLLEKLSDHRVVVIKSSHRIDYVDPKNKDTYRYKRAGAIASIICAKNELALLINEMGLEDTIHFAEKFFPDVILIEGYKSIRNLKCRVIDIEEKPDVDAAFQHIVKEIKKKRIEIFVDEKKLSLNTFVENMFYETIKAMLSSLKRGEGKRVEIMLDANGD